MGLAPTLFSRWIACIAGLVCAVPGKGVGGLGKVEARKLESFGAHRQNALATFCISDSAHDCDEFFFARHAGYVPDVLTTLLELRPGRTLGYFRNFNGWSAHRRNCSGLDLRSNRAQTSDGHFFTGRNSRH